MYAVNEADGSITVAVVVVNGILRREVIVDFTTQDNTALCKCSSFLGCLHAFLSFYLFFFSL